MPGLKITSETVDNVLQLVGNYLQIDGYYSRRDELNIRCTPPEGDSWRTPLKEGLARLGLTLKVVQRESSCYLNIYSSRRLVPWLNIVLFLLTVATVATLPGYFAEGEKFFSDAGLFAKWLGFAVPLLLILLVHEFGHYIAARRAGIRASLPYFIPFPNLLGTFGAFIKMKSAIPTRRDLVTIGAAGPLAGFVVAVLVLALGMSNLTSRPMPAEAESARLIEPLIYHVITFFVQAQPLPEGHVVYLWDNPMLYAAWVGLFLTMLNLFPVAQLDGGHIIYALFPRSHSIISRVIFVGLIGAGFLWAGWWMLAVLIFLFLRLGHPATLDDTAPLGRLGNLIGLAAILVFVLCFTPVPF